MQARRRRGPGDQRTSVSPKRWMWPSPRIMSTTSTTSGGGSRTGRTHGTWQLKWRRTSRRVCVCVCDLSERGVRPALTIQGQAMHAPSLHLETPPLPASVRACGMWLSRQGSRGPRRTSRDTGARRSPRSLGRECGGDGPPVQRFRMHCPAMGWRRAAVGTCPLAAALLTNPVVAKDEAAKTHKGNSGACYPGAVMHRGAVCQACRTHRRAIDSLPFGKLRTKFRAIPQKLATNRWSYANLCRVRPNSGLASSGFGPACAGTA